VGIDPYTQEVASVYPDLFGQGQFVGKGIYDVQTFHAATGGRFPENRILSHDLIEGCHARCGFLSDVELIENEPSRVLVDANRRHRWTRGDWQIASWLFPRVPGPDGGPGAQSARPAGAVDDLRQPAPQPRAGGLFLALASPAFSERPPRRNGPPLLAVWFLPAALRTVRAFAVQGPPSPAGGPSARRAANEGRQWGLDLLELPSPPIRAGPIWTPSRARSGG
jgi:hypothetical protein